MASTARATAVLFLVAVVGASVSSGCACFGGAPDCAGASVIVDVPPGAPGSIGICIDDECATAVPTGFENQFEVRFDELAVTVRDNDDFLLAIDIVDETGGTVASTSHMRDFTVDDCSCLSFPYRLEGDVIERAD